MSQRLNNADWQHATFWVKASGVRIEFAPEWLREGPTMHMMCDRPSDTQAGFIWLSKNME